MKRLWRRFRRLCRESEIRLDAQGLRPEVIEPGDRLQIGPWLWRVERVSGPCCFELLTDIDEPRRARLHAAHEARVVGSWLLEEADATTLFSSLDLVHFPAGRFLSGQ